MKKLAAVAISGGIDSLYTAHLLMQSGYEVIGIHFITGYDTTPVLSQQIESHPGADIKCHCTVDNFVHQAISYISSQLGIPIHIIDCSSVFKSRVVNYFTESYKNGTTPSPCLVCNPLIKFGVMLDFATEIGAEVLATGHYARTAKDHQGKIHLFKGVDSTKDQSYFLAFLNSRQLKKSLFPLGDKTKKEITEEARKAGLSSISSSESQDICFIKDDYKKFLLSQSGHRPVPGLIKTGDDKTIGKHNGLHSFTVGQRRGINCPGPFPYYVLRLDTKTNTLIVGPKEALLAKKCTVQNINWINEGAQYPKNVTTQIRHSHKGTDSTITQIENNKAIIKFSEPVSSITPGQGAVFYNGDEVLGGGWII